MTADAVELEGGQLNGQYVELSAMDHEGLGKHALHTADGVYRHDEEAVADFRDGRRVAVFVPAVPAT